MKNYKDVVVGGKYETNNFGDLQVISIQGSKKALVRFTETGYETVVELGSIRTGQVKDWSDSAREWIGKTFPTTTFGDVLVLEYKDNKNVKVRFLITGHEDWFHAVNIKNGKIQDVMARMSCGLGYIGIGPYNSNKNKSAYKHWIHMLQRCTGSEDKFKNYHDKTICQEWECFQNFAEWAQKQKGFEQAKWQLDKDILVSRNKIYSPETCCFVPHRINSLIIKSKNTSGFWCEKDRRWYFSYREPDSKKTRKGFKTQEEGMAWYAECKETVVKSIADEYKELLDDRTYAALYSWKAYE